MFKGGSYKDFFIGNKYNMILEVFKFGNMAAKEIFYK